ncbi:MAG: hypothetical protein J2P18_15945, partial [Nocardia sp.]|nr:hypothetical protein [Nocardia sp.]
GPHPGAAAPGAPPQPVAGGPGFGPNGPAPHGGFTPQQPYSVPFDQRPAAPPRKRGGVRALVPLILLGILVVVLAVAAMCTFGGRSGGSGGGGSHDQVPLPEFTTTAPFTPAPEKTVPSQPPGHACYPFQPGCPG